MEMEKLKRIEKHINSELNNKTDDSYATVRELFDDYEAVLMTFNLSHQAVTRIMTNMKQSILPRLKNHNLKSDLRELKSTLEDLKNKINKLCEHTTPFDLKVSDPHKNE